jgi:hypothetical protein
LAGKQGREIDRFSIPAESFAIQFAEKPHQRIIDRAATLESLSAIFNVRRRSRMAVESDP